MRKILAYFVAIGVFDFAKFTQYRQNITYVNWKLKVSESVDSKEKKKNNRCSIIVFVFPPKWNISKIQRFRKMWAVIQWTGIFSPINLSNYATFPYLLKLLPFSLRSKTWWNWSVIRTSSLPWSSSLSSYIFS